MKDTLADDVDVRDVLKDALINVAAHCDLDTPGDRETLLIDLAKDVASLKTEAIRAYRSYAEANFTVLSAAQEAVLMRVGVDLFPEDINDLMAAILQESKDMKLDEITPRKVRALMDEMCLYVENPQEFGLEVYREMLGFFSALMALEDTSDGIGPNGEDLCEKVQSAWHALAEAEELSLSDVALKARLTMLYRDGCKSWGSDTFCDDDYPYLQKIIEGAAKFATAA